MHDHETSRLLREYLLCCFWEASFHSFVPKSWVPMTNVYMQIGHKMTRSEKMHGYFKTLSRSPKCDVFKKILCDDGCSSPYNVLAPSQKPCSAKCRCGCDVSHVLQFLPFSCCEVSKRLSCLDVVQGRTIGPSQDKGISHATTPCYLHDILLLPIIGHNKSAEKRKKWSPKSLGANPSPFSKSLPPQKPSSCSPKSREFSRTRPSYDFRRGLFGAPRPPLFSFSLNILRDWTPLSLSQTHTRAHARALAFRRAGLWSRVLHISVPIEKFPGWRLLELSGAPPPPSRTTARKLDHSGKVRDPGGEGA